MKYRNTTILAEKDVGEQGTEPIQIKVKDVISRITITWKVTKSKHGMDSYPHKDITKIEVKNGSDILFGLDGGQAQALNLYDRKAQSVNHGFHYNSNSQRSHYAIDFGRFLFDPLLALDPKKFENLMLEITYDEDVSDTGVGANGLEVFADVFDEKVVSPLGFLMSKEINSRTPPASGYFDIHLPTDHAIRKLLVQGYYKDYEPWNNVSEAKLSEDNDKRIPFDWNLEKYQRIMKGVWTPIVERLAGGVVTTGQVFYVVPTDYAQVIGSIWGGGTDESIFQSGWQRGGKLTLYSGSTDSSFGAVVYGFLPNHCFEFPFGDPQDIEDWYEVSNIGDLNLRLKAGSGGAVGTVATILQQLRRY